MRLFFCIGLWFLSVSAFAQGESFTFHKLDIRNGLSNNQVRSIIKDKSGLMWFGTASGLNRYDGYSFKTYGNSLLNNNSLSNSLINYLYELPDNKMWVQSVDGSYIFNFRNEQFESDGNIYLKSFQLPIGYVTGIVKGNNDRYWFIYETIGLYLYSASEKKSLKLNLDNYGIIKDVKEIGDNLLWIVYQSGLIQKYDIAQQKIIFSSDALQRLNVKSDAYSFMIDKDGDLWIWGFSLGIFLFDHQNNTVKIINEYSTPTKLSSNLVNNIIQDNNGLIWIATDHGGITLIDKKNNFKINYLQNDPANIQTISQNSIVSMYKDNDGIIWLGTFKNGINYFIDNNITKFENYHNKKNDKNSLQFDDVNCFTEDKTGNIWIGTNGGGLIYFDRKNNSFRQFLHNPNNANSISSNTIVTMCVDENNVLWMGTFFGGLCSFDGKNFTTYLHHDNDSSSISTNHVWALYNDNERRIWIGTLNGVLDFFNSATKKFEHFKNRNLPISISYISTFLHDKNGSIWVGTSSGILVLDKNKNILASFAHNSSATSLSNDNVMSFLQDSKNNIWIGTRGGLNLYNEKTKTFKKFTSADGLPDNVILSVLEDKNHTLWISTPRGLCDVVFENNGDYKFFVVNYDEANGLQNIEFSERAALKTRSGDLFFGGPSGFNIINPDKILHQKNTPQIIFNNIQILNKKIEVGEEINNRVLLQQSLSYLQKINLKYKENVFTIEFAAINYIHNANEKYAYMLQGFNTDWLYTTGSNRNATYTNLSPGLYTFKVKVLGQNGIWSEVKTLEINIMPPFWRTTLAYIIYVVLLIALLWFIRRITLERIHMRYEVVQQKKEVERVHALEQLKTKFFTNVSHEFRTPLSLIITPLDKIIQHTADNEQKQQLGLVYRNAKRLLNLVNQLLDFRKMEVQEVKLFPAVGDIVEFCKEIGNSFSDISEKKKIEFNFSSNVNELEIYFDKDKMEKILFNLLSNAYKYTFDNGKVSLKLIYTQPKEAETHGMLAIEIADSGIGIPADKQEMIFERFFQTEVPESMVNLGMGIGLAITKEFVKLHSGIISVKSEPDKGTCFTVLLPAKKIFEPSSKTSIKPTGSEEIEEDILEENLNKKNKKTILLVEDNEDIRFYLKDNLKKLYHLEEAANGKEAWEKLKSVNPDLVVSDIMMPVMDGIELARKIKNETATAHIPIILLTAMGSEEKQLEGYNIGVSDYITKPFIFNILASRIKNLLAQQKLLQKKFHKQIEVNPAEVTITSVDENFLKQALEIVEKNISNADFSVEDFSSEIFMNRVTLYRKIHALTGKTPIEFIRSIRLKRAAQLLEKSGKSIAEIAYEVGFNNPKNFSKFFKEEFLVQPSQYATTKKDKTS